MSEAAYWWICPECESRTADPEDVVTCPYCGWSEEDDAD